MPSRTDVPEYAEYLERIEALVAVVNHRHGTPDWMPIDLKLRDDLEEAVASYKHYDVMMVNAMFDGMNLVAKEGPLVNERDGVSILCENTGAHEELGEFALSVNPFDVQELADAIYTRADDVRRGARAARRRAEGDRHVARSGRLDRRAGRGHPQEGARRGAGRRARRHSRPLESANSVVAAGPIGAERVGVAAAPESGHRRRARRRAGARRRARQAGTARRRRRRPARRPPRAPRPPPAPPRAPPRAARAARHAARRRRASPGAARGRGRARGRSAPAAAAAAVARGPLRRRPAPARLARRRRPRRRSGAAARRAPAAARPPTAPARRRPPPRGRRCPSGRAAQARVHAAIGRRVAAGRSPPRC